MARLVGKVAVLGMWERKGKVKAMPIASTGQKSLQTAISDNIETGSQLYIDDQRGYMGIGNLLYKHEQLVSQATLDKKSIVQAGKAYASKQQHDFLKQRNKQITKTRYIVERTFGSMLRWCRYS